MADDNRVPDAEQHVSDTYAYASFDESVEQALENVANLEFAADTDVDAFADSTTEESQYDVGEQDELPPKEDSPTERPTNGATQSIRDGIEAFKNVRKASELHSSARSELESMRERIGQLTEELKHRIDIEERYPQIVAEQTAELERANAAMRSATETAERLRSEKAESQAQLETMKREHEERLKPYRSVAESAKGRADDTARALADAKRAVKGSEAGMAEATKRRDQRISAANRAVDNAKERLHNVNSELEAAKADESTDKEALERMEAELASEQTRLATAQADVTNVMDEARKDVEDAQSRLFEHRRVLKEAERKAETAKNEATARREEYDTLLKNAQERERALQSKIKELDAGIEQAGTTHDEEEACATAAQALLDEAEGIHTTPQQTLELRDRIAQLQTDFDQQQDMVDELAANERSLRKGTFKQRLLLVLGIAAAVVIAIAVIAGIIMLRNRPSTPSTPAAQTETSKSDAKDKDKKDKETDKTSGDTTTSTSNDKSSDAATTSKTDESPEAGAQSNDDKSDTTSTRPTTTSQEDEKPSTETSDSGSSSQTSSPTSTTSTTSPTSTTSTTNATSPTSTGNGSSSSTYGITKGNSTGEGGKILHKDSGDTAKTPSSVTGMGAPKSDTPSS